MATSAALPDDPHAPTLIARLWKPELLAILLVAVLAAFRVHGSVDPDTSWQLWTADRAFHGARLYRDIVELNPPLWFWMALPIDRVASWLGMRADALTILVIALACALSLLATGRLLTHMPERRRAMLLAYAALILFAMPWMHIGQREQIVLIGALPYAALVAARRTGRSVSPWLAAMIGAGAALGFALKHYFLLAPTALELWLVIGQRRSWRPLRPEIVALVAVGVVYAAALLIWARDFLRMIPLIRIAYGASGAPRFIDLFQPPIWVALLIAAFVLLHRRRLPFATAFLIAGIAFGAAYFIQSKGWLYHSIPLVGCVSLSLASLLAETEDPPASLRLAAPALLALPLAIAAQEARTQVYPTPELDQAIAGLAPGTSVGFLATDQAIAWSVTYQHRLRYPSRYSAFWMLRAIIRNEHRQDPDPRLLQLHRDLIHNTVVDLECAGARRIIVSRPSASGKDKDAFDILPFLLKDPEFAAFLRHYRSVARGEGLDVYDLATPLVRPASSCARGL